MFRRTLMPKDIIDRALKAQTPQEPRMDPYLKETLKGIIVLFVVVVLITLFVIWAVPAQSNKGPTINGEPCPKTAPNTWTCTP